MSHERRKKKDAIADLKDSLYSREQEPEQHLENRTPLPQDDAGEAPVAWEDTTIDTQIQKNIEMHPVGKKRMSLATKFFLGSVVFFLIAAGSAAYLFFNGGSSISPQNIDVQVISPSVIDGGKATSFEIIISNRNQSPLQLVDLSIDYPSGTRDPKDQTKTLTHELQSIGALAPGQQVKRTINALFYGQEGAQQKVAVTLQYSVAGSNSVFQKQSEADFTIGSSPVSVSVAAPQEAIAGQQFTTDITVTSNSPTAISNVVLQGQYPFGFSVVSTAPSADTGGTIWRLGTLSPGQSKVLHLTGTIDGQDGDERVFRFQTGTIADPTDTQIKVPFITVPQSLTVHRPFVSASIALNDKTGKSIAVVGQQTINGTITWQNNLTVPVSNLELHLVFSGPMLDTGSINPVSGFYQSQNATIIWSKDQDASLAEIPPGGSGVESFSFSTLPPGQGGTVYTNPVIDLNVSVSGVREGQSGVPETVSSAATTQATIASALLVDAQALHFTGPFTNSGPMPPVAESPTTYAIVWTVKNPSNTIANALVQATLPQYVQYVSAQASTGITYDPSTRVVSWSLGDLKAGAGYSSTARVGAFEVALTPSVTQVGTSPALLSDTKVSGQDRFAQVGVSASAPGPTIILQNDTGFTGGMGQVAPKPTH